MFRKHFRSFSATNMKKTGLIQILNLLMADMFRVLNIILDPKAEIYLFNQVKELLQIHENTLSNVFKSSL